MLGYNIALDDSSGAVHILDELSYRLIRLLSPTLGAACQEFAYAALPDYSKNEIDEAYAELKELSDEGLLFSNDDFESFAAQIDNNPPVKAVCLHISHDCDMRCKYCFAGTGCYNGERATMEPDTAIKAMDFVKEASRGRKNIEVDFFGGEPLMAWDTVVKTIEYVREHEKDWGKSFRFTMTTNALGLDDAKIEYLNREMDNIVLSLDGRPEVNDALRRDAAGRGTYDRVVPGIQKMVKARKNRAHYVRGTFTAQNLDFAEDVLHMANLGFKQISIEPVVTKDRRFAIKKEDLPRIFSEYERLCEIMLEREKSGIPFNFFHFCIDLEQGPCVIKRLRGCGAGAEYVAITPDGGVYPCHRFAGKEEFRLGSIYRPVPELNRDIMRMFARQNIYTRPGCRSCFARFYCSGGCSASNYEENGDISKVYEIGCELERKRVECAIALKAAVADIAKTRKK
jgi:uncharacterized protein